MTVNVDSCHALCGDRVVGGWGMIHRVARLCRESVADPDFGQQQVGSPRVALDLVPQAKDAQAQGLASGCRVCAPQSREDLSRRPLRYAQGE